MNMQKINYRPAMITIMLAFFMWGFLTCLNDILVPDLKSIFNLNYARSMLVQFCFFITYAIMSIPMSKVLAKIGYKRGVVIGFIIGGAGCLLFILAAALRIYEVFLFALFVLASGIVLLQVSANPYVTLLGDPRYAASRLTFAQALNSLGTTIAPWFGGLLILGGAAQTSAVIAQMSYPDFLAYQQQMSHAIQHPYLFLALVMIALGIVIAFVRLPKFSTEQLVDTVSGRKHRFLDYPHLVMGCVAIFMYVGAEVSIGSLLVNYFEQPDIAAFAPTVAAKYVSYYWGGAMIGRFLGSYILKKIAPGKVLAFNAWIAILLLVLTVVTHGNFAVWTVLAIGLFNSIMFPTIFSLALEGLGDYTPRASGFLCTAIFGGAIIPVIQGFFADHVGIHLSFIVPIICYLYIVYYGYRGHKERV